MNLKCRVFLALVLTGLLLPLVTVGCAGDHASVLMTIGVVIIVVMALCLWSHGEHTEGLRMKRGADL